ncbi:MAG: carbohydrate ABC transporter permease [Clostridia bacterium]|nr:carbohydrate ABC transporter permease [Clostridia bacterium]
MTNAPALRSAKTVRNVLYQVIALLIGLLIIAPILYCFLISFMPSNEILSIPPRLIPSHWILEHYQAALTYTTMGRFMINSLILAATASISRVLVAALAAYALAFFEFRGRNLIFMLFMGSIMIPSDVVLVTNYQTVSRLGLINTYLGMMIIFLVNANNIFMMRQYFLTFSKELKEASEVDGCSNFRFFLQILLPLSTPTLTTVFISSFIGVWNQYLWPMLVTNDNAMRTVQVGVTMLNFPEGSSYGPIMAASMLVLLPTVLLFIIFRRKIIGGIMGGSVKG